MDRTADAASFTGQTLAWFDEGEELAASERDLAAERVVEKRGRGRLVLAILLLLALVGFAAVMAAPYLGFPLELPWTLPWES